MNPFPWLLRLLRAASLAGLLGASLIGCSQHPPITHGLAACSWPFESNGRGITNVATPDTHATYWVMPFDTGAWKSMLIQGKYPEARFANFNSYTAAGALSSTIVDEDIIPDPGSTNPFAVPSATGLRNYTLTISSSASNAPNTLRAEGGLAFVVFRVYLPDQGVHRTGGMGLPVVSLVAPSGDVRRLEPCPFAEAETSLPDLVSLLRAGGFFGAADLLERILRAAQQRPLTASHCNPGEATPAAVSFGPSSGSEFFANPQTRYLETAGLCSEPGSILVIRGKAPVFPNTYLGGSVFQPAFDGQIQLRYWSMCNNHQMIPNPVVECRADFETGLDQDRFYTYVVSSDPAAPSWIPPGVTWLPWGATGSPKGLMFRNILPIQFAVAGDYIPRGVFCSEALFRSRGWQGCFAAAAVR